MLMDGKKRKRYLFAKLLHFSHQGIILSEMPVIAQKDVLQRDVNVYRMELSAVLIVMEASLAITS